MLVILTAVFALGCATGSGSAFRSVTEATAQEDDSSEATDSEETDGTGSSEEAAEGRSRGQRGQAVGESSAGGSAQESGEPIGESRERTSPISGSRSRGSFSSTTETTNQDSSTLVIESNPRGASVYLNDSFSGTTPLTVDELTPGEYRVAVDANGYYRWVRWITVEEGQRITLEVELQRITGHLSLSIAPSDARVSVDEESRSGRVIELPVGTHTLTVRKFGFETVTSRFTIRQNRTTSLSIELERAPFRIEELSPSRPVVNPQNPGRLGELDVRFRVSAPGTATFVVRNSEGQTLLRRQLGPFRTWDQSVAWRPVDETGQPLPEGEYELSIVGSGTEEVSGEDSAAAFVRVSKEARIRYRALWSGLSGAMYSPTPEVLPAGSVQLSLAAAGHQGAAASGGELLRVPTQFGLRIPIGARGELNATGTAYLYSDTERNRAQGGLGIKWQVLNRTDPLRLQSAVAARGTIHGPTAGGSLSAPDTLTNYAGASLGTPVLFGTGPISLTVMPELHFAPAPVLYGGESDGSESWEMWGYLRGGALLDWGPLSGALSAALRTTPFSESLRIDFPVALGAELHWLIPETLVELSFISAAEVFAFDDYYIMAGGGLGIIY